MISAPAIPSPKAASVVKTVIDLCDNLGMVCVAEGVETQDQADQLARKGCILAQGFLYGRPVAARDVTELLQRPVMAVELPVHG